MFKDCPKAIKADRDGRYFPSFYSRYVCIGKPMTLEKAQEMYRRDTSKDNTWGKKRKWVQRNKGDTDDYKEDTDD
tara:strand:+ start:296 stop:520 length:225 start_codon:yes stop_codon:yes gene_type:complete